MENWLKGLIAAACIVVIAGGGYFGVREYQRSVERAEAQRLAEKRAERSMCDQMLREFTSGDHTEDWRVLHISFCVTHGYLSEDDFSSPRLSGYLEQARETIERDRADAD